ncbi:MAG: DEAD/DEAH box helicase family protein [Clostridia bacterium]|nr:DEAD/DEAH box helicase family protein [Clostridia bacterium]
MKPNKFISSTGVTYEILSVAENIETGEDFIIYRTSNAIGKIFVCSKSWWTSQNLISQEQYANQGITKYSSSDDKIKLYMSLFIGRNDVYARRWESKSGKCGYSPVCLNEWKPAICLKPSGKCQNCDFKDYAVFDGKVIEKHLSGTITAGVYPLLKDETCRFAAIDFDDENWQKDINAVFSLCKKHLIPAYIERSRSGSGGHLWIFFSENIPASLARTLCGCILSTAMNDRHEIKFSSYDRIFPNQDTMPKGGFGNLIALPLQKIPRKNGNSVFIDENFHPYPDQWAFLSNIKSLSKSEVNHFIKNLNTNDAMLYEDNPEKPWEPVKPVLLSSDDFPSKISIVSANMIYIEKKNISSKGLSWLKHLASFKNPEFYKSQAMRLSTYGKPRIISSFEETEQYIGIPRGLYDDIVGIFTTNGINIDVTDKTNMGIKINAIFNGQLRPEQEEAKNALLRKNCGILSASTAFGKTVVATSLIAEYKTNTLILVHRTNLLRQWMDRLNEFLIVDEQPAVKYTPKGRIRKASIIGQIGGTKNNLSGIIDVAVMQSLISDGEVKDIVRDYGMVIVDECHHVSAFTFEKILKTTNAKYVYGLTATPTRQDGHQPIIYMQLGHIAYKSDNKKQSQEHPFEHYMIPRFTSFKHVSDNINDLYANIIENELRNDMIVNDCITAISENRTPIILTERTRHVDILAEKLKGYNVIKLTGGMGNKQNQEITDRLNNLSDNEKIIIIATGKYIGEGFDFPRLDTLLLAMPISWKGTLQQYAGRLHRTYEGKSEVRIYDYIDINVPMLERMYQKRLLGYSSIGYKSKCVDNSAETINSIFDNTNFLDVFAGDITAAKRSVVIASPFVSKRTINKLRKLFDFTTDKINIITRPPECYKENDVQRAENCIYLLKSFGITVRLITTIHQNFAVIDERLIWYGSLNLLCFGNSEESIMRLESAEIAEELLNSAQ